MIKYLVQHGNKWATGQVSKEFAGRGSRQQAMAYAKSQAEAGLLNDEYPIEVFRAEFRREVLWAETVVAAWRV